MKEQKFPAEFLERLRSKLGDEFDAFLDSQNQQAPVSLRVNPFKRVDVFDEFEKVSWAKDSFYLPQRISFTLDPLFHAGCYYVQEASSMFLEQALRFAFADNSALRILDLCAAPGGKSTHIASLMPPGSLLVSNELISSRNIILQQNITKWGVADVVITQNEPTHFSKLEGFFDLIVVDAPCSGEGLFRKDADATGHWSIDAVAMCAIRQQSILDDIYPSLKEGGLLIYSTCTYEESENENQIKRMINDYNMEMVKVDHTISGPVYNEMGTQFYPHRIKGEGFFMAVLRKKQTAEHISLPKFKSGKDSGLFLDTYITAPENFTPFVKNNELYALPLSCCNEINLFMNNFFVRKAGIHIGTIKGKDLVPSHELALSTSLNQDIPKLELSREDAIRFMKCESVNTTGLVNGWVIVTFNKFPLGWIKVIGNRSNNYYPRSQRILKM